MEKTNLRTRSGEVLYRAICSCGHESFVRSTRVSTWTMCRICKANSIRPTGMTRDRNGMWSGTKDIPGEYFGNIKRRAQKMGITCTVTKEFLQDLFEQQQGRCAYSGVLIRCGRNKEASLDRIDPKKGYDPGNVQWLHKRVNWIKNTLDEHEFFHWVRLIAAKKVFGEK